MTPFEIILHKNFSGLKNGNTAIARATRIYSLLCSNASFAAIAPSGQVDICLKVLRMVTVTTTCDILAASGRVNVDGNNEYDISEGTRK